MSVRAIDVAEYILRKQGSMSAMKLQKLLYYAQAWHMVWEDDLLFPENIEAWANGPVVRELFEMHRGQFRVEPGFFSRKPSALPKGSKDAVDRVLAFYAPKDAQWLSDLTHMETPWKAARRGLGDGERGNRVISTESMNEYYSSL